MTLARSLARPPISLFWMLIIIKRANKTTYITTIPERNLPEKSVQINNNYEKSYKCTYTYI